MFPSAQEHGVLANKVEIYTPSKHFMIEYKIKVDSKGISFLYLMLSIKEFTTKPL